MDTNPLKQIGLTDSEIKVYLALIKIGQSTSGKIVDESRVTRSKIYDILERLKNKGLVSHITKESTKYFSAADPNVILDYLDKKEEELLKERISIKKILPELLIQKELSDKGKIAEIFIGIKGMKNAFKTLINEFNSKEIYYAFGASKGQNEEQVQIFFSQLHQQRIKNKVKSKIIFNESSRNLFKDQEKSKYVEARYLKQSTPSAINVYKDYTIIAILNKEPITILIKNKEPSESFKEYLNIMWKIAKP